MQQTDGQLVTPAEYARLRGLNRSTISRQIRAGKILTHDGLIVPTEADEARAANLDLTRGRRKPAGAPASEPLDSWELMNSILAGVLAFGPAAMEFLAREFIYLGDKAPEVAKRGGYDFLEAILTAAVEPMLPGYSWLVPAGYDFSEAPAADDIANRLSEFLAKQSPPPAAKGESHEAPRG